LQNLLLGDWLMIVIYSLLMVVIGLYCARFAKKGISYFAGGRRVPWWLSGVSGWMGAFSAYVFVGMASAIYKVGMAPLYHLLYAMSFAWLLGALFWAARWRRTGIITVPEYMEKRFNLATRQVFAWVVTPFRIADDGVKCYATAFIIAFVFGIPAWAGVLGLSLVTIAYTVIGGLWAVMITDVVQFVILVVVMFVVVPVGLGKVGWLSGLAAGAPEHFFRVFHDGAAFDGDFTLLFLVAMWLMHPFLYNGSFTLVQRYTTVPSPADARRSAFLSMALGLVFFPLILAPPMISRVLYGDSLMAGTSLMETSYIRLCVDLLPVGMIGVVVVALMAATMSALSADYNIYGAVLTNDLYHRLINPAASQRKLALVGKLCTLIVGGLALVVALSVEKLGGAFKVMMTILGLIGGPTTIPILLGLWLRRPSPAAAISALAAGVGVGAVGKLQFGFNTAQLVLTNIPVTTAVFLAWGWLWPARGAMKEKVDRFFERLQSGEALTAEREEQVADRDREAGREEEQVPSAFKIAGVILGVIGLALGLVGLFASSGGGLGINLAVSLVLLLLAGLMIGGGRFVRHG